MNKPVVWLVIPDTQIESAVRDIPALSAFQVESVRFDSNDWLPRLHAMPPEAMLVQADRVQDQHLVTLMENRPSCEIMLLSEGSPNPLIDQAMRQGASFHFRLPLEDKLLQDIFSDIHNEWRSEDVAAEATRSDLDQFGLLLGSSPCMRKVYRMIRKVADTDASVMIVGESGCGKELVANTLHQMSIAREEIFGPVLCIIAYDSVEEAIRIANDSPYGLHAYVSSVDEQHARDVAVQLQAGRVCINGWRHEPMAPFGGFRQSGLGREFGIEGLRAYLEPRVLL